MIIKALVDYYEALSAINEEITKPGYSSTGVSYGLCLNEDGDIVSVKTLTVEETIGKKKVVKPRKMNVPEQVVRSSGVKANFLCDNSSYLLCIDDKGKSKRTKDCFNAAKDLHLKILSEVDDPTARAVCSFFEKWDEGKAKESLVLEPYLEEIIKGANLVFIINGIDFVHDSRKVKEAWEKNIESSKDANKQLCIITGEQAIPAVLHSKVKGVTGAQSSGANLISFNAPAFESYGNSGSQGLNAPVSEYAAYAYVTALNYLISDRKHRQQIGDTTVVYWAENADTKIQDIFNDTAFDAGTSEDSEKLLSSIMESISSGRLPNMEGVDFNTNFYILGLAPNASRLSVRFFLKDSFGNFITNIAKHYKRLEIVKPSFEKKFLTPYFLLKQTVSPNSRDQSASPLLGGAFMRAVLSDYPYPALLYNSVLIRIKAERDINPSKAAIVKACLIKNYNLKEEATLALNENCTDKAYILGRLFAVLEKVQEDANPGINSTIKDRYFTSACATPSSVFPVLLRLSNHHLAKLQYGRKMIGELMDKLEGEPLPDRLTLKEQGLFILGYYHQVQKRFEKRVKENDNESEVK